jgi:hypothetical protein
MRWQYLKHLGYSQEHCSGTKSASKAYEKGNVKFSSFLGEGVHYCILISGNCFITFQLQQNSQTYIIRGTWKYGFNTRTLFSTKEKIMKHKS